MLPTTFNCRAGGCCITAARIIAGGLAESGVKNVIVVEGWIQFIDEDGGRPDDFKFEHTWVVADEIIDPAIEQLFEHLNCYAYERIILEEIPVAQYLADERMNTTTPEQFFDDGVIPGSVRHFLPKTALAMLP